MSGKIKFNEADLDDDFGGESSDDQAYTDREKYLVKKYKAGQKKSNEDDGPVSVLGFNESSSEDEGDDSDPERFEADSDLGSERGDDIPDAKSWGKSKHDFYNTNYVDKDYSSLSAREEQSAQLEEEEARNIQLQLAKHLNEADFSLDVFIDNKSTDASLKEVSTKKVAAKVKADLSGLTLKQKQQLLKKDSPEFKGLVDELNAKTEECYNELEPIIEELKSKNVPDSHPICNFIRLKNQLHLTYATNITFYLLLKASQKPIKNHPILKRLVQLKELLAKLDEKYEEHIRPEVERLLEDLQEGKVVVFDKPEEKNKKVAAEKAPKKKLNIVQKIEKESGLFDEEDDMDMDDDDDEEGRAIERKMEALLRKVKEQEAEDGEEEQEEEDDDEAQGEGGEEDEADEEMETDEKRKITYQIAKNKGLTPHRKKEQRNPRVKHRQKFRKALIRRKGAIRTVRTETKRYSGEHSGIKSTVRKGIKIK